VVLIPDIAVSTESASDAITPGASGFFPVYIPAGERLSARCSSSVTDATDRKLDVIIYGAAL
jgi:hypothetical protein